MSHSCGTCVAFRRMLESSIYGQCHIGEIETTHVATEIACDVFVHMVDAQEPPLLAVSAGQHMHRSRPRARDRDRFRGEF